MNTIYVGVFIGCERCAFRVAFMCVEIWARSEQYFPRNYANNTSNPLKLDRCSSICSANYLTLTKTQVPCQKYEHRLRYVKSRISICRNRPRTMSCFLSFSVCEIRIAHWQQNTESPVVSVVDRCASRRVSVGPHSTNGTRNPNVWTSKC